VSLASTQFREAIASRLASLRYIAQRLRDRGMTVLKVDFDPKPMRAARSTEQAAI
jgi:hypothetical protein